jgi:hypothetical protein
MFRAKFLVALATVIAGQSCYASKAEAGPLLDWLFGRRRCFAPACAPAPTCATCTTTCQQTCSRVVVNYVPQTCYRTEWERIPVTTYQQTTSSDPCTGCTVTCNRPCTTYNWQMKQIPYTTYRPVYTQETYQVPVTYTSQVPVAQTMPMAAPVGGCSTCAGYMPTTVVQSPVVASPYPQYYQTTPQVIAAPAAPVTSTPADQIPTLGTTPQSSNQPVLIQGTNGTTSAAWPTQLQAPASPISPLKDPNPGARWDANMDTNSAPQLQNPFNQTTHSPSVERWGYSPVRLASYEVPAEVQDDDVPVALRGLHQQEPRVVHGRLEAVGSGVSAKQPRINEGWRND